MQIREIYTFDYYPYGMLMPGRSYSSTAYKYGFGNQLKDDEIKGAGNSIDFGARQYDPRLIRWISLDPVKVAYQSQYVYCSNDPIRYTDKNGRWQTDGHFWTVYLIGTMLGLPNARELAYYAEYPDTKIHETHAEERYTWAIPFVQQNTHSLSGKDGPTATDLIIQEFMNTNSGDAKELGRILHKLGDSYAHRKLDGNGELYGNWGFTLQHALGAGSTPDMIGNRYLIDPTAIHKGYYLEYVNTLVNTLAKKYNIDVNSSNFNASLFNDLAKYAYNNGNEPISLRGIINYHVAVAQGGKEFFVHNVQSLMGNDYANDVLNTKNYLDSKNIKYTTVEVTETIISGAGNTRTESQRVAGTKFNLE